MESRSLNRSENYSLLLKQFNNREIVALENVYSILYNELHRYAKMLYYETDVEACDVVHDAFINLWENKQQQFAGIINIKAFILVSIKNSFKNHVSREKYRERQLKGYIDDDYFVVQVAESEIYSIIPEALNLLPEECARVIRLTLDGLDINEIAELSNKKSSTIYNQRREAIRILKEKLPKDKFIIIILLLDIV